MIATIIFLAVVIAATMFIGPVRHTVFNIVRGAWFWLMNQGPRVRLLVYCVIGLVIAFVILLLIGFLTKSTAIVGIILVLLLIPFFFIFTITALSKILRPVERNIGLVFMFFTPIIVFLMGDIEVALSPAGVIVIGAYATFCFFFLAFGKFKGKVTDAPAYFLTFFPSILTSQLG